VTVDSNAKTALTVSGTTKVTAGSILVVGGVSQSGSPTLSPAPTTGVAAAPDPLANLPAPSTAGLTNYGEVSYSSGTHTLHPGIYTSITASGSARLTLTAGVYILEGGGLTVSGSGVVSGTGVMLYNTSSSYPTSGGTYGSITISNSGILNLTAPTTGPYAGVVIFQDRSNTKTLTLSGSAFVEGTGNIVYAPNAQVFLSGSANLQGALVAGTLSLSGNSDPGSGSPASSPAAWAAPSRLSSFFDLEAAGDALVGQPGGLVPGAAFASPAWPRPDAEQSALAPLAFVEAPALGASPQTEPAWLGLAGASPIAPTDAVDAVFSMN
jgi:hypothetical protein